MENDDIVSAFVFTLSTTYKQRPNRNETAGLLGENNLNLCLYFVIFF